MKSRRAASETGRGDPAPSTDEGAHLDGLVRLCALDKELSDLSATEAAGRRRLGELGARRTILEQAIGDVRRRVAGVCADPSGGDVEHQLTSLERELAHLDEGIDRLRRDLDRGEAAAGAERGRLQGERVAIVLELPLPLVSTYEAIARSGRQPVVARVEGGYCRGCFIRLPPQLANSLRHRRSATRCPHCHRIVYDPIGLGGPTG